MNFKNFFVICGTMIASLCFAESASAGGRHHHGRGGYGYNAPIVVYNAPYGGDYRNHHRHGGYERCHEGRHGWGYGRGYNRHHRPAPVVIYNQGYHNGYGNYGYPQRHYYDSGVGFNINLGGRL